MRLRTLLAAILALCFLPAAARASAPPLVGLATHPFWDDSTRGGFDHELDLIKEAGGNEVRIDISWSSLQLDDGAHFNQAYVEKADEFFADAHARGIKVVATFWTTPCWASRAPASAKQGCTGAWWDRGVDRYPPTDPQDFADAAAYVASRWGADLAALEVWNEPNFTPFFNTSEPASDYAPMLNDTYAAVKAVAPNVAVIGPAMLDSDWGFLKSLYANGIAGHFDGISLRPFNAGRDPRTTEVPQAGDAASFRLGPPHVRAVMAEHGDSAKKLWFTEIGWSSCVNQPPPAQQNGWCVGEDKQAQYIAGAYRIVRDDWDFVQLFSVYTLRNTGTSVSDREAQMGLITQDFDPKPSYDAFRAVLAEPPPPPQITPPPAAAAPAPAQAKPPRAPVAKKKKARPGLSRLWLSHGVLTYKLTQRARVSVILLRPRHGRWVRLRVRRALTLKGRRGTNRVRLAKLLGDRLLPAGRYRLTFVARDAAGTASAPSRLTFRLR
jgi:hypothetical protein